jgi:hypothetical protein
VKVTRRFEPQVEPLDGRIMPTSVIGRHSAVLPGTAFVAPALPRPPAPSHQLALSGQITGTWAPVLVVPDLGRPQTLKGAGSVGPLGSVQASGSIATPGFVLTGWSTATITLTRATGSVTLQLIGPPQPGFSPPPGTFHFTITGGTGAYAGATGQGTATLTETRAAAGGGTFKMAFTPATLPLTSVDAFGGTIPPPFTLPAGQVVLKTAAPTL